jgi:pyruvate-formate lyase-activating enzyme
MDPREARVNIGILLWNKCNAECAHCAPYSSPREKPVLTDDDIFGFIDAAFHDCDKPKIGLSGGEAFLYYDRLCRIVRYAIDKGAQVSVNTNCSWAVDFDRAHKRLKKLKEIGLTKLVVSTDDFHKAFIDEARVAHTVRACKAVHLEVELQFVATKRTGRLADFLSRFGDDLMNVRCREIPCHPTGRAKDQIAAEDFFLQPGLPSGFCPSAILSLSAEGTYMPCCNTAGDLPTLQVGSVAEQAVDVCRRFKSSALLHILTADGPKTLVEAAEAVGYQRKSGYVDQCHLCHDLFSSPAIAAALKEIAIERATLKLYDKIQQNIAATMTGNEPRAVHA